MEAAFLAITDWLGDCAAPRPEREDRDTTLLDVSNPLALIVGPGPELGAAGGPPVQRRSYDVALVARSESKLGDIGAALQSAGVTAGWAAADVSDAEALRAAVSRLGEHTGRIDVLHSPCVGNCQQLPRRKAYPCDICSNGSNPAATSF
jgi:hypothetical protein